MRQGPFYEIDLSKKDMKGRAFKTAEEFCAVINEENKKVFFEGNATLLTSYFQQALNKKDVRVCYFGDHLFSDVTATNIYNELLTMHKRPASWQAIAVIEEMTLVDTSLEQGVPAHLIPPSPVFWGPSYFSDNVKGQRIVTKFMHEAQTRARYAVALISNIERLF